jgi:signal transduction histidine kinase
VLAGENENLSDSAKDSLRLALDEGTTFQRTLQNILDLWRIRQGEMPVEIQDLNFVEVVDEAIFSVQDSLASDTVQIHKRMPDSLPKIKTDLAKVNQILFLLLDNAAKFTLEGQIELTAQVENGILRCQIEDTGIGICPDDQQYIFDEFFQVDSHVTSAYRGAGLGLSLVRDLLELLDGSCAIKSEAGRGTTAIFEIPVIVS